MRGIRSVYPGGFVGIRSRTGTREVAYGIELQLTEQEFSVVQALFAVGKHPLGGSIATPDLQYGNAPDGSDKEWDIVDCPYAKITGFELVCALHSRTRVMPTFVPCRSGPKQRTCVPNAPRLRPIALSLSCRPSAVEPIANVRGRIGLKQGRDGERARADALRERIDTMQAEAATLQAQLATAEAEGDARTIELTAQVKGDKLYIYSAADWR